MKPVVLEDCDPSQEEREKNPFHDYALRELIDSIPLETIDFSSDRFDAQFPLVSNSQEISLDTRSSSMPNMPLIRTQHHPRRAPIRPGFIFQMRRTTSVIPKVFSYTNRSNGERSISNVIDLSFTDFCRDSSLRFSPTSLGFIPVCAWDDCEVTFGSLVINFFQRRNNASCRFVHKLYNALRITETNPDYFKYVGVTWINHTVMTVHKGIFAQLLGIKNSEAALFHLQGNFPSHGFVEVNRQQALELLPLDVFTGIESDDMRLLQHANGIFVKDATEASIRGVIWIHP
jgi:hypothetical protein